MRGRYRCPYPSKKIHPEAVMRTVHVFPLLSIGSEICYRILIKNVLKQ
jgi:hypothetical protein